MVIRTPGICTEFYKVKMFHYLNRRPSINYSCKEMPNEYAYPEVLVDTQWTEEHINDPKVRIAEVDYDPKTNYFLGHVPGAVLFDWKQDINDPVSRNVLSKQACEKLLSEKAGLNDDSTLVLYGDFNNWFAAFGFRVFKYYGYKDIKIMNGGRKKWLEEDRQIEKDSPTFPGGNFKSKDPDEKIRTYLNSVSNSINKHESIVLVDVRFPTRIFRRDNRTARISYRTCPTWRPYSWSGKYTLGKSSKRGWNL